MEKTRTKVKINGKEYVMAGYESEEYIHRVAIYVDRKMTELREKYVNLNAQTLAVLAAINIADDHIKLQDQYDELSCDYLEIKEQNKELKSALHTGKETRQLNVSSIKKQGRPQYFDGYK